MSEPQYDQRDADVFYLMQEKRELEKKLTAMQGEREMFKRNYFETQQRAEKAEGERDQLKAERDDYQQRVRTTTDIIMVKNSEIDALRGARDSQRQRAEKAEGERDALRALLRGTPHDVGCHPSEGIHTERCQRVRAAIGEATLHTGEER